jgi:Ca2+-binding RTX toxin-like protein
MLSLFILPALLGLALIINASDDDDIEDVATPTPEPTDVNTITATPDQSELEGTPTADRMIGNDRSNEILGFGGNDYIEGGAGDDAINAGNGDDTVLAGSGDDFVTGGRGDDRVFLGDGNDEYLADDEISEMAGDDFVRGGDGRDYIADALGSNELRGDLGADTLIAFDALDESGNYSNEGQLGTTDTLLGGFGNDILAGDAGDEMEGFVGNDTFIVTDDEDSDLAAVRIIDFFTEEDTLMILQLDGLSSPDAISYTVTDDGVSVAYEGRVVALLEGLDATDVPAIQTTMLSRSAFEELIS